MKILAKSQFYFGLWNNIFKSHAMKNNVLDVWSDPFLISNASNRNIMYKRTSMISWGWDNLYLVSHSMKLRGEKQKEVSNVGKFLSSELSVEKA